MPVIPCCANLLQDEQKLAQFLLACREKSLRTGGEQIVSVVQKIDLVDPLAILKTIDQPHQPHFYWENPSQQETILGYGVTKLLTITALDRFSQSQLFIKECLQSVIRTGDIHLPWSYPHFFCSFTFFAANGDSPFPPATVFLPEIQLKKYKQKSVLINNVLINHHTKVDSLIQKIKTRMETINAVKDKYINTVFEQQLSSRCRIHCSDHFQSNVNSALQLIRKNHFSKIVLAHSLDVISPAPFQLTSSLENLRKKYPDCYIFSVSNGKGNIFLGASPERLIKIKNQQLITDALAGSSARGKTADEDNKLANKLLNSEKEKREHQAVSQFIFQRLSELGLQPKQSQLQLLQLANIQHLWTPITAYLPQQVHPLEIVAQLHPTPAVAGVPTDIACQQIRHYEAFDRSLYAAPLGWIDSQGNSEFIVGIRSAMITDNQARLYAGAGIVAGSNPDKELAEVQLKLQTILNALT